MAPNKGGVGIVSDVNGKVIIVGGNIFKEDTTQLVTALQTQILSTFQPRPFDGCCPYKCLDVFDQEGSEQFFRSEKLAGDFASRVGQLRVGFFTGPSSGCRQILQPLSS